MGRTEATPGAEGVCGGRGWGGPPAAAAAAAVGEAEEASLETVVVEGPEVAEVVVDEALEVAEVHGVAVVELIALNLECVYHVSFFTSVI